MIRRRFITALAGLLGISLTATAQTVQHQHVWYADLHMQTHPQEIPFFMEVEPGDGYAYFLDVCLACGQWRSMGRGKLKGEEEK